jgi:protein disulfide-isomerase
MKIARNILAFLTLFALSSTSVFAEGNSGSVTWTTNYQDAVAQSKQNSQPIVLFFTGSDWCGWCKKLDAEALDTPDFAQATNGKFIFVKVDFPMKSKLDPQTAQQNNMLKQKYEIKGYPTLVIIDGNEKILATTGYEAGGGKKYANHLESIIKR